MVFSEVHKDTRGNRHKWEHGVRKEFYYEDGEKVEEVPRAAVKSLPLEIHKIKLDKALSSLL